MWMYIVDGVWAHNTTKGDRIEITPAYDNPTANDNTTN